MKDNNQQRLSLDSVAEPPTPGPTQEARPEEIESSTSELYWGLEDAEEEDDDGNDADWEDADDDDFDLTPWMIADPHYHDTITNLARLDRMVYRALNGTQSSRIFVATCLEALSNAADEGTASKVRWQMLIQTDHSRQNVESVSMMSTTAFMLIVATYSARVASTSMSSTACRIDQASHPSAAWEFSTLHNFATT